jgi:hypothetical protein
VKLEMKAFVGTCTYVDMQELVTAFETIFEPYSNAEVILEHEDLDDKISIEESSE